MLIYQDKQPCTSSLLATALAAEKALQLAAQRNWQAIEIKTYNPALLQALRQGLNTEVGVSVIIDQCLSLKNNFTSCTFRRVDRE